MPTGSFSLDSSSPTPMFMPLVYLQITKLCPLLLSFARLNKPNSLECGWEKHSRDLLNLGHWQERLLGGPFGALRCYYSKSLGAGCLSDCQNSLNSSIPIPGQFLCCLLLDSSPTPAILVLLQPLACSQTSHLLNLLHWIFVRQSCS